MLVFEKNGQGKWDFDFEVLEQRTSEDFVMQLKAVLKHCDVQKIKFNDLMTYLCVYIETDLQFIELAFKKGTKVTTRNSIGKLAVEELTNEKNS